MTRRWFSSDIRFSNCLIKWLKSRYQEPAVGQRNSHLLITIFNSIYQLLNVFVRQSWIHELLTKSFESLEEPLQKRVAESGSSKIIKGLFDPLQFWLSVQNWMKFKIARHSEKAAGRLGHSEKEWRWKRHSVTMIVNVISERLALISWHWWVDIGFRFGQDIPIRTKKSLLKRRIKKANGLTLRETCLGMFGLSWNVVRALVEIIGSSHSAGEFPQISD